MRARWGWLGCALLLAGACDGGGGGGSRLDAGADLTADRPADAPASDAPGPPFDAGDLASHDLGDLGDLGDLPPATPLTAKLDLLFVVDNSGSMAEEQANLVRNFPLFMQALGVTEGPAGSDVQIAVVSTDLGAATAQPSCVGGGDMGLFCRAQTPASPASPPVSSDVCARCGVNTSGGRFLRVRDPNFTGSLSDAFSCMARLGTFGCGFEHSLGALTTALAAAQNGPFLRPDAFLAFVIITDEDDCTAPPASTLFASPIPDQDWSLRCALEGHVCNGAHNTGALDVNMGLAECQAASDGALRPVGALVNEVLALKSDPSRIVAAGIFGWPLPGQEATARYRIETTSGVAPIRTQRQICQSNNGAAAVGYRVKSFVESFPHHAVLSICQDDFRPVLEQVATRIRSVTGN